MNVFRPPTVWETEVFARLLESEFPARRELAPLLSQIEVRTLDEVGTLELRSRVSGKAPVLKRIPVECEAKDEDGYVIHVLLHVVDGRPDELELYKDDGSSVSRMPPASSFELVVLPPWPAEGGWL